MPQAKIEKRTFGGAELRATRKFQIEGYAARFDNLSRDLGSFKEKCARGCFARSLKSPDSDVRILVNHDPSKILGRVKAGTATVAEDSVGLRFNVQLDPAQQSHQDLYAAVRRGDLTDTSFAFMADDDGDLWSKGKDGQQIRTLTNVRLLDCSIVCYPAYEGNPVDARSLPAVDYDLRARVAASGSFKGEEAWDKLQDEQRAKKAAALGKIVARDTQDWFSPRYAAKEDLMDDLQDGMDEEYGSDCYRVIDACPDPDSGYQMRDSQGDESVLVRGTLIARAMKAEGEEFIAQDFDFENDEDENERQLKPQEVSSMRKISLRGRCRSVTPSGTTWQSSLRSQRAIDAAVTWTLRDAQYEQELRAATAAGNWDAVSRIKRLRGK